MTTTLTLTRDKQALLCDGAPANRNACGRRYLPEVGQATATTFIKSVNFDPIGSDASWQCSTPYQHHNYNDDDINNNINFNHAHRDKQPQQQLGRYNFPPSVDLHLQRQKIQLQQQQHFGSSNQQQLQQLQQLHLNHFRDYFVPRNSITFYGSYYNVYVKVADCEVPSTTRAWGHEPKIRSQPQSEKGRVIIPDPTQTAMRRDVISTWHYYAKMTSIQHAIYLQLWRPVVNDNGRRRKSTSLQGVVDPVRDRNLKSEGSTSLNGSLPRQKHRRDRNGDTKSTKADEADDTHMFVYRYRLVGQVFDIPKELRFNYIELKEKHCADNNSQEHVQDGRGNKGRNKAKADKSKADKTHVKTSSKTARPHSNHEKQENLNRSRRWKTRSDPENEGENHDDDGGGAADNVAQNVGKDGVKHVHPYFLRSNQSSTFINEATNKTNSFKFLTTVNLLEYQKLKSSSPPLSSSASPSSLSSRTAEATYEDPRHPDYHHHHQQQRDTPHYHHHHHHFYQPPHGDTPEVMEVEPGDVLGLFFPFENPVAWSAVPCALNEQRHLYFEAVLDSDLHATRPFQVGQTVDFSRAAPGPLACRQYSITAVLSEHPESKFVDDWLCPSWPPPNSASHRHHPSPINPSLHPSSSPSNNANVKKPYSHSIRIDQNQRARYKYLDVDGVSRFVLMKYAFSVLGCLSLVMIIVGVLSYVLATRK